MSYERLVAEHDEIERLLEGLDAAVGAVRPDPAAAALLMRELGTALAEHNANETRVVYTRLIDAPDRDASLAARDFHRSYERLRADTTAYFDEWTSDCIAADWETFAAITRDLVSRLRERVKHETATIYMLALRKGAIRLRAA